MSQLIQDLRFAVRNLSKQPGLALAAILTLALGIGVNSAIFSIVDSVLLTPPPFRDPGRVIIAWASNPALGSTEGMGTKGPASDAAFYDFQRSARSFERMAMMQANRRVLTGQGEPELLGATIVTGEFFNVLGARAALGRTLQPGDDVPGKTNVVVLSHALWMRHFGGDRSVIGRVVSLNNKPYTVVGVMDPRFTFPHGGYEIPGPFGFTAEPDVYTSVGLADSDKLVRDVRYEVVIGRLRPGVSMATAQAELRTICRRLAQVYPQTDEGWTADLQPILEVIRGGLRPALLVLWAAVGFVLLIACANVANLLLARAASRQKEIAVRIAMGAGRRQLLGLLLAESGLLSLLGGLLGLFLAWVALRTFATLVPPGLATGASFSLNGHALVFTAALCIATSVLAGLVPALQLTRPDLAGSLREGTRAGASTAASRRTRSSLVVAEVAIAVLLLISAGLLLRSFSRLLAVDPGFRPAHILTLELGLPVSRYQPMDRLPFLEQILEKVKVLPGVRQAALISDLPTDNNGGFNDFMIEGRPAPKGKERAYEALMRMVSPGYFELMGVPLRRGRFPLPSDRKGSLLVAVIDEAMAKTFWPGEDPVGKRFTLGGKKFFTVIGIAGSVREAGLMGGQEPHMYLVLAQIPGATQFMNRIVAKTEGDPQALSTGVRQAVHQVDPDQPVSRIRALDQMVSNTVAKPRFSLLLLGLFALLALVLSIVGIYGVTAYSVSQRTRELGLRMALGAERGGVLRMVVQEAGMLAGLGVLIGVVLAFFVTRVMASLLYGISATDPLTFVAIALGLVAISLAAAYLPGRKATRVDPIVALRAE